MTAKPVTIAGVRYKTRNAIQTKLSALLQADDPDDAITAPEDVKLLSALFYARPEKVAALNGRKVVGWGREKTTTGQCFAALLDTGEKLHFSYLKSLNAIVAVQAGDN